MWHSAESRRETVDVDRMSPRSMRPHSHSIPQPTCRSTIHLCSHFSFAPLSTINVSSISKPPHRGDSNSSANNNNIYSGDGNVFHGKFPQFVQCKWATEGSSGKSQTRVFSYIHTPTCMSKSLVHSKPSLHNCKCIRVPSWFGRKKVT